jgi:hypothetical protein
MFHSEQIQLIRSLKKETSLKMFPKGNSTLGAVVRVCEEGERERQGKSETQGGRVPDRSSGRHQVKLL